MPFFFWAFSFHFHSLTPIASSFFCLICPQFFQVDYVLWSLWIVQRKTFATIWISLSLFLSPHRRFNYGYNLSIYLVIFCCCCFTANKTLAIWIKTSFKNDLIHKFSSNKNNKNNNIYANLFVPPSCSPDSG